MAENDLYATTGAVAPGYGDQMDPLGTAGQNTFGQAAPAAGFGAAPVEPVLGAAPASASVKIGKAATPKKKLSTGKKIAYGVGGLIAAFLGLVIVLDPGPQKGTASPKPPAGAPAVAEQTAPQAAAESTTVMGGSPAVDPLDVPPGAQPAASGAPTPAAASASSSAPAPAAPAQAPAAPTSAPAAPAAVVVTPAPAAVSAAPAKPVAAPAAPTPAPAEKLVMAKEKAPAVPASPEELAARVATLEKRLARYERSEARERAQAARAAAQVRVAAVVPAPSYRPVPAPAVVEIRKPAVLANDNVRVVGVSTRHGVTTALVDFGGAKHRVAAGEAIPGLGTVSSVAVDAAGNPVVEVNGVRYQ